MTNNWTHNAETSLMVTTRMDTVQPEPIQWLWPSRIALGKVTLIAGDPGLGKSMLTTTLAAHITQGTQWPVDATECPQGDVIMMSAEDDPGDTIRPRLDAAGADAARVHCLMMARDIMKDGTTKDRSFNLAKDIEGLGNLVRQTPDCRLITIDPISAYLGGTDSHNNADIRALLTPLAAMASKYKVAIVVITHLNKSSQANALYRASGSLAFVAAARAVFSVVKDPDDPDRRLFLPIKNNLGDDKTGFAYQIITASNDAPVIEWESDLVEITLEEMADAVTERKKRPVEQVKNWLGALLSAGEVLQERIKEQAEDREYAWRTVMRAKKDLGVISTKHQFDGKWTWKLPDIGQDLRYFDKIANDKGCQAPPALKVAPLGDSGTLGNTKGATSDEGGHNSRRDKAATFDEGENTGSDKYPPGFTEALAKSASGLNVTPGQVAADLDPEDYQDFIDHPKTARNIAERIAYSK